MTTKNKQGWGATLSSVQQGMVFHHLSEGQNTGVDIEQIVCDLGHSIDPDVMRESWRQFVSRYEVLRSFINLDTSPPTQMAGDFGSIEIHFEDWSSLESDQRITSELGDFLEQDRFQGFDIAQPPLMRVSIFGTSERRNIMVWTFHHLLLDGRSFSHAIADFFDIYDALVASNPPPDNTRPSFQSYSNWLASQNWSHSISYWRELLEGTGESTSLRPLTSDSTSGRSARGEVQISKSGGETDTMIEWAKSRGVTLNALIQSAWAIVHARYGNQHDICIGSTRAGRAGTVSNADQMLGTFITTTPTRFKLGKKTALQIVEETRAQHIAVREHEHVPLAEIQRLTELPPGIPMFESLVVHDRLNLNDSVRGARPDWTDRTFRFLERTPYPFTLYVYEQPTLSIKLAFDRNRIHETQASASLIHLLTTIKSIMETPDRVWNELPLLPGDERRRLLVEVNDTGKNIPASSIHALFEALAKKNMDRECVVSGNSVVTYGELSQRATNIAGYLQSSGVQHGDVVAISLDRSIDMVASILGVLKAGAAYLPLDPDYPVQRIKFCLSDSGSKILITSADLAPLFRSTNATLVIVEELRSLDAKSAFTPTVSQPDDLAYTIYTSGSTGKPKGVLIEHRNAVNFFAGMDDVIEDSENKRWLAVTSISFDISILEILWTLTRGYTVVLAGGSEDSIGERTAQRKIAFSLFYFASDPGGVGREKYDLVLKGAQFADQHGFEAIWTPERHFHAFGGLYPNPSVIGAAVAAITKNIGIRSGSVVLPLHHPIRVVEEWSLVDNLCNGKVGLSIASGWQPNDFVLAPERYENRRESMYDDIETVRRLWRGDSVEFENPKGDLVEIQTLPRPVQSELPIWITAAGSPDTFRQAGEIGANLLTHLLGQTMDEVAEKIKVYRQARRDAGHGDGGTVSMMLHTFVGQDNDSVRELVREPMKNYLRSAASLVSQYADAWTAYKQGEGNAVDSKAFDKLGDEEMESLLDFAFERYYETSALFGTPEKCTSLVEKAHDAGVDEIACLIDFGVENSAVLDNLKNLNSLKTQSQRRVDAKSINFSDLIIQHDISHMQCTPSGARTMLNEENSSQAISSLNQLIVGGEAFPTELWKKLRDVGASNVVNMYGPTETTIWSTSFKLSPASDNVFIGQPIANTQCYVLDKFQQLSPKGIPGELYIGGQGVARGYHARADLSAERFIHNPYSEDAHARMYATGDIVRWNDFDELEFLERSDHQVKIRGFRVELGEIETRLSEYEAIDQAVVVAIADEDGSQELVAYCKPKGGCDFATQSVVAYLSGVLPEYMVPSRILVLEDFPLTPNKKVDRKKLPKPAQLFELRPQNEAQAPRSETEQMVKKIWESVLGLSNIGTRDNFFEIGGHSLRAVQVQSQLRSTLNRNIPITDLFRFPTIEQLAANIGGGEVQENTKSIDRAARRKAARARSRRKRV